MPFSVRSPPGTHVVNAGDAGLVCGAVLTTSVFSSPGLRAQRNPKFLNRFVGWYLYRNAERRYQGELKKAFRKGQRMVLEVHEGVVTDLPTMHWLRDQLNDLGVGLAYDDFGAGQSRLTELAEVPPDFIKLDMSLIRGIDLAEAR